MLGSVLDAFNEASISRHAAGKDRGGLIRAELRLKFDQLKPAHRFSVKAAQSPRCRGTAGATGPLPFVIDTGADKIEVVAEINHRRSGRVSRTVVPICAGCRNIDT